MRSKLSDRYRVFFIILALFVCLTMCFADIGVAFAFAEDDLITEDSIAEENYEGEKAENDEEDSIDAVLVVFEADANDQKTVRRIFTQDDLALMNHHTCSYSTINNVGTVSFRKNVTGIAVEDILMLSGFETIKEDKNRLIKIIGYDGVWENFLSSQLFASRYYYPNIGAAEGRGNITTGSFNGGKEVPATISITNNYHQNDEHVDGRLYFGQCSPTEQNNPAWVRGVANSVVKVDPKTGKKIQGEKHEPGRIVVYDKNVEATSWKAIRTISGTNKSWNPLNTKLSIDRSVNETPITSGDRCWIYYTMDGSNPTMTSPLYNYQNKFYGMPNEKFNNPTVNREGKIVIKTKVVGYGKKDSTVSSFQLVGANKPAKPKIKKITSKRKTITIKWTKVKGARGYIIYRATKKKGSYVKVKTISKATTLSWKNKKLKKKKSYYYRIAAYKVVAGKTILSDKSAMKYKKIK